MTLGILQLVRRQEVQTYNFTLSGAQNFDLPANVKAGQIVIVYNDTVNNSLLTIRSSSGATIDSIRKGFCLLNSKQDTPTLSSHWKVLVVDDYGTWTPVLKEGANTLTASENVGEYHRHNNDIVLHTTIANIVKAGTGTLTIEGLPFTPANVTSGGYCGTVLYNRFTVPASSFALIANIFSTSVIGLFWNRTGDVNTLATTASDIANATTSDVFISISYTKV